MIANLVTGGAGFIGSHLCNLLLKSDQKVICMDNLSTGNIDNIKPLLELENFTFVQADVLDPFKYQVDRIFNLACPASPIQYQKDPVNTLNVTVKGIFNCIDLALETNIPVLHASTSEVYGDPATHPQTENYWGNVNPIGPRACYNEAKRFAETALMNYHHQFGLDIRIARIFNTYGPNMQVNDGRVVSNFIVQALQNKDLTIYGDGTQTRSFCYCSDLTQGLIKLIENKEHTGPINIGNNRELTMIQLAETIISLVGSDSRITFEPLPEEDPVKRKPDIGLAKKVLDWEPEISLEQGLLYTITYFKHRLGL